MAWVDAIRQNRDDDLPRLMFADWLEERGELGQASFIRQQVHGCENAVTPPTTLPTWIMNPVWERGFVVALTTIPRYLWRYANTLDQVVPLLDRLTLMANLPVVTRLRNGAVFPTVRALTLSGHGWNESTRLGSLSSFPHLEELNLENQSIADAELLALVRLSNHGRTLRSVRRLRLSGNQLTDAAASVLLAATGLDQLELLVVDRNRIRPPMLQLLENRFGVGVVQSDWPVRRAG
jgi:uncharacterized protein (TIGR02996 family)